MIVGEGATLFARQHGFPEEDISREESRRQYRVGRAASARVAMVSAAEVFPAQSQLFSLKRDPAAIIRNI